VDILEMAGSTRVLQLHDMLGGSLATWTIGGDCRSTIISRFDELILAEFPVMGTPLVGKTLAECGARENFGVSVVGIWERGQFSIPNAGHIIGNKQRAGSGGNPVKTSRPSTRFIPFYHVCNLTDCRSSS
jgi:Trk K+ transport system NAD-binding subunit